MLNVRLPRVYPIVDTTTLARLDFDSVKAAAALLDGGARILQFRHKGFWSRNVFAQAQEIATLCGSVRAPLIINDRADYAGLLKAGVHLGQDDLLPTDARTIVGPEPVIGFSTHNPVQVSAAQTEPVDYVAFGPVFTTESKERPDPTVGIEGLRTAHAINLKPLVAIGGITRDNAPLCWDAGAASVAVIGDLLPYPCTHQTLRERMEEWLRL